MTDRATVDDWMRRYVAAWSSNDPDAIRSLFTDDGEYRFHPWEDPAVGQDAILAAWLEAADEPDDHAFQWAVVAVDGDTAVVQGRTAYSDGDVYENLWVLEIADDGRARAFTEWYMEAPVE